MLMKDRRQFSVVKRKILYQFNTFITACLVVLIIPMAFHYNMVSLIVLGSVSRCIQFIVVPIGVIMFYYSRERGETLSNVCKNKYKQTLSSFESSRKMVFFVGT